MVNKSTDDVLDLSLNEKVIKKISVNASIKALNYFKSQGIIVFFRNTLNRTKI